MQKKNQFAVYMEMEIRNDIVVNPIALRKAKIICNFGLSECKRVKNKVIKCFCCLALKSLRRTIY